VLRRSRAAAVIDHSHRRAHVGVERSMLPVSSIEAVGEGRGDDRGGSTSAGHDPRKLKNRSRESGRSDCQRSSGEDVVHAMRSPATSSLCASWQTTEAVERRAFFGRSALLVRGGLDLRYVDPGMVRSMLGPTELGDRGSGSIGLFLRPTNPPPGSCVPWPMELPSFCTYALGAGSPPALSCL
jgi:hypothetical protein